MKKLCIFGGLFLIGAVVGAVAAVIDNSKRISELEEESFYPTGWNKQ